MNLLTALLTYKNQALVAIFFLYAFFFYYNIMGPSQNLLYSIFISLSISLFVFVYISIISKRFSLLKYFSLIAGLLIPLFFHLIIRLGCGMIPADCGIHEDILLILSSSAGLLVSGLLLSSTFQGRLIRVILTINSIFYFLLIGFSILVLLTNL